MTSVEIVPFEDRHAPGVARLCTTVQWPSLTDPATVRAVCTAPTTDAAESFYEAFEHRRMHGSRPGDGAPQPTPRSFVSTRRPSTGADGFRIYPGRELRAR